MLIFYYAKALSSKYILACTSLFIHLCENCNVFVEKLCGTKPNIQLSFQLLVGSNNNKSEKTASLKCTIDYYYMLASWSFDGTTLLTM